MATTVAETREERPRRRLILIGLVVVAAAVGLFLSRGLLVRKSAAVASFPVQQGEFVINLTLKNGELEAAKAEQMTAPRVRGQLKITQLFPEGEVVDVGDLVIEFDRAEFEKRLTEAEQALEAAKAEREKTVANQGVEIGRLESDIENRQAEMRLAQLQVDKMEFESMVEREEAKLKAKQAELALEQARKKLDAQRIVDEAELRKREIDVSQRDRDLERARTDLESLTIRAERPGLVVYEKIWKGSRPEKIRVGDEPWGGMALVTLPDLSTMRVKTWVNEVDVDRMVVGQPALIKLDALPGPVFHGTVTSIASLGREKEGDRNVKVFDVLVEIQEKDHRLKPGMSATSEVVIETIPPRPAPPDSGAVRQEPTEVAALPLYIPIDAVFEKGGRTLVYRMKGNQPEECEVVLGKRNENYVVVEQGLGVDDRIALRDPTLELESLGGVQGETAGASPGQPSGNGG
ncbi:MAG: efflux RND transporter periplasmic adaptor subunit [Gemmatimonadota bacterium]